MKITNEDIAQGVPGDPERCPVAIAYKRNYPKYKNLKVLGDTVEFDYCRYLFTKHYSVKLSPEIQADIKKFDAGGGMAPFETVEDEKSGTYPQNYHRQCQ